MRKSLSVIDKYFAMITIKIIITKIMFLIIDGNIIVFLSATFFYQLSCDAMVIHGNFCDKSVVGC